MLHGEVEQTVDVVLDGKRGQIRDEEREHVFALRGDIQNRRLLMVAVHLLLLLLLLVVVVVVVVVSVGRVVVVARVVRVRERCDSHRAGRAG